MKNNIGFAADAAFLRTMNVTPQECIEHVSSRTYRTKLAHGGMVFTPVGEKAADSIIQTRIKQLKKIAR